MCAFIASAILFSTCSLVQLYCSAGEGDATLCCLSFPRTTSTGECLSPDALNTFKKTLVQMNHFVEGHKDRMPFGLLTGSNTCAYTTWALFAIISALLIL